MAGIDTVTARPTRQSLAHRAACHGREQHDESTAGRPASAPTTAAVGTPAPPDVATWPSAWRPDAGLLTAIAALLVAHLLATGPLRRRWFGDHPWPWTRLLAFVAGLCVFLSAVFSPLDEIGEEYLFVAHMLQHSILIYIVPPLLLWGLPVWLAEAVFGNRVLRPLARVATHPLVAFVMFNVVLAVWHMPGFYEWALRDKFMHDLEHMSFLLTALATWWPLMDPAPRRLPGFRHVGLKVLYVTGLAVAHMPLFFYLVFATRVRYPTYATAPRLLPWLSPLEDQALGGIAMQVVAAAVYVVVIAAAFARWGREEPGTAVSAAPPP